MVTCHVESRRCREWTEQLAQRRKNEEPIPIALFLQPAMSFSSLPAERTTFRTSTYLPGLLHFVQLAERVEDVAALRQRYALQRCVHHVR